MFSSVSLRKLSVRACLLITCAAVPLARADAQQQRGANAQSAQQLGRGGVTDDATRRIDAFAALFVAAFETSDASGIAAAVSSETLVSTVLAGVPVSPDMRRELGVGMMRGFAAPGGLLASVLAHGAGDTILYRGAGVRDGRPVARFRMLGEDGFRFIDISFRAGSGDLAAVDVWGNGEWLSQSIATTILGIVPSLAPLPPGATPQEVAARRIAAAASTILARRRAGDFEGAIRAFEELPSDVRSTRLVMRLMLGMPLPADDPRVAGYQNAFVTAFPDDPESVSLDIDRCFVGSDFAGEARAIERMIRVVGEDAYLRFLLASALQSAGRLDAALVAITRAVELEPTLSQAQVNRADIAARLGRFDLVTLSIEALDAMELEPEGLHDDPVFAEYRRTADYRRLFP